MVGPVPNPEKYIEKLDESVANEPVRNMRMPNGQYVVKDNFFNMKNGLHLQKYGKSEILTIFGCDNCRWVNSELCPHRDNGVTHMKPHSNGICSQRLKIPMALHEDGVTMTGKQMLQVRGLMDAEFFSKYVQDKALKGERDINDVFAWEKLKADILDRMRKQDEGSKVQITKNSLDDLRKTIEIRPKIKEVPMEVEVVDDGLRKEEKEISGFDIADDIHSTNDDLTDIHEDDEKLNDFGYKYGDDYQLDIISDSNREDDNKDE